MAYNQKDYFFKKAKKENYAARSIFKLQEIDDRFHIIKPGYKILDLGAAPGSWSQYASQKVGAQGRVLGLDLQQITIALPNAVFVQADMRDTNLENIMKQHGFVPPFDVVLSDMAPKTTGIRITDQARSMELCELALATAERFLRPRGSFVAKLFHSEEFEVYRDMLRERFGRVEVLRPKSTRKESKEIFFIAMQFKGGKAGAPPA
ncbi:MAG: RlmE family RNA methyltransferase [Oligoflexia bacterium]|nr:RlmE family RNA methyltransferase [Oligoflexia bacterium]